MIEVFSVFIFILGLCVGSFLNVVIFRLEKEKSFVMGRSRCLYCQHQLGWLDLIPVVSFLFLRGKCRYCSERISTQYPLVEIVTGLLFVLIYNLKFEIYNQFEILEFLNLLFLFYIVSSLIVIFVYDLKFYLIPDKVLFPAIFVTFLFQISNFKFQIAASPLNYIFSAIIASGFFLIIFLISRGRWMGFGDVKLAILMGLLLGFPNILLGLFLSFFFGAILGIILLCFKKKGLKSEIPFAPFLILGTMVAMFWGKEIIYWYLNVFKF